MLAHGSKISKFTQVIISGIQPTGIFHIGNLFGALQTWENIQNSNLKANIYFFIADLHAITKYQNPNILRHNIKLSVASLLSCGIDPKKVIIFQQSKIKEHSELCWILSCLTTMARLAYMPVWKDGISGINDFKQNNQSLGIFSYPVLQSADIMLYRATHVPIGEDQMWHLHLCQHLVQKFNSTYKTDFFPTPQPIMSKFPKTKALRKPDAKMSKSDVNAGNRIEILDDPDVIVHKINRAVTDPNIKEGKLTFNTSEIFPTKKSNISDGLHNLLNIYLALKDPHNFLYNQVPSNALDPQTSHHEYIEFQSVKHMKEEISQLLIAKLKPIQKKFSQIMGVSFNKIQTLEKETKNNYVDNINFSQNFDNKFLDDVLIEGYEQAQKVANQNIDIIKSMIGII